MRKYLLPEAGNFYKANMHCHTNISDGCLTPEEVKAEYVARGYSIVAYTDHNTLVSHNDLSDESFLALNGFEVDILDELRGRPINHVKTCHICLVALSPDNLTQVCFHRKKYIDAPREIFSTIKYDEDKPDFERVYTPECISEIMKTGRDNGFFVTYNHPMWSLEDYRDYSKYFGMHAMEICNYGSYVTGMYEYNPHVYDELLREGRRIYCVAGDDNHNPLPTNNPKTDSFGAFTMIKAEKLDYESVAKALLEGNFYASQGPKITALWVEDGEVHIECEDAAYINFNTNGRRRYSVYAQGADPLTHASFKILDEDIYVRVSVVDKCGKIANTNAYFVDEFI